MALNCSVRIRGSQQAVFDAISDLEHSPERVRAIQKVEVLTDGPVGKGTRWRETRTMFGKACTEEMEITEFDAPNGYRVGADNCGCHYDTRFSVRPDGDDTIVEMSFRAIPTSLKGRLLMQGTMKKMVTQDLMDLKAHVEGGAAPGAGVQPA
jgi:uncharacterized membrane protein